MWRISFGKALPWLSTTSIWQKRRIASNTVNVDIQIQINVAGTALSWNERITVLHEELENFGMIVITESLALRMTKSGYVSCRTVDTAFPASWNEPCH